MSNQPSIMRYFPSVISALLFGSNCQYLTKSLFTGVTYSLHPLSSNHSTLSINLLLNINISVILQLIIHWGPLWPFLYLSPSLSHWIFSCSPKNLMFLGWISPCSCLDTSLLAHDLVCCGLSFHIWHILGQVLDHWELVEGQATCHGVNLSSRLLLNDSVNCVLNFIICNTCDIVKVLPGGVLVWIG